MMLGDCQTYNVGREKRKEREKKYDCSKVSEACLKSNPRTLSGKNTTNRGLENCVIVFAVNNIL